MPYRKGTGYWDGVPGVKVYVEDVKVERGVEETVMEDWRRKQMRIAQALLGGEEEEGRILVCDAAGLRSWAWCVFAPAAFMQGWIFWGGVWAALGGWVVLFAAWAFIGGDKVKGVKGVKAEGKVMTKKKMMN